jgi:hypothetical protein
MLAQYSGEDKQATVMKRQRYHGAKLISEVDVSSEME